MADTNKPAVVPPKRALTDYPVRFSSIPQLLQTRSILTLFAAHRLGPVSSTTGHILALHLHGSEATLGISLIHILFQTCAAGFRVRETLGLCSCWRSCCCIPACILGYGKGEPITRG